MIVNLLATLASSFKRSNSTHETSLLPILSKLAYFEILSERQKVSVKDSHFSRQKQLGNLIIKARLDYLYPDKVNMLYGMLLYCNWALIHKPDLIGTWQEMGKNFSE